MHPPCQAPGRQAAARLATTPTGLLLAGCASGSAIAADGPLPSTGAFWAWAGLATVVVAVALLAAAGLAYALGALRERRRAERSLREARAEQRAWQQLGEGWHWQTDSGHRLTLWQGPGHGATTECALFETRDAALAAQLRSMQAFSGLRLSTHPQQDGVTTWALRGVPRHDDLGAFAGFVGRAQPMDSATALATDAAALPALLSAWPGPALLALRAANGGWQVAQANAAARALWPALQGPAGPADVAALAALLPPAAAAALREALADNPPATAVAEGWQVERFGDAVRQPGAAAAPEGLLLARHGGADGVHGVHGDPADPATQPGESDNFSFTASHDLRAPIRVVEGFTRIVKEDYGHLLDRVGNDHLDRVLGAAARMNLMIDALLTLARLSSQPLARQPVNLSQLAAFVIDDLKRAAPEREADIDIEPGLTAVGDPTLLRLVLENLLGNAWKYSGRADRAQISLRTVPHDRGRAYVVRDNGAGFDMRSADRLFGLFQRLHSASDFPGHGVGLASVRRIVLRHGGDIWAEAEPGRGAAFFFTLAG